MRVGRAGGAEGTECGLIWGLASVSFPEESPQLKLPYSVLPEGEIGISGSRTGKASPTWELPFAEGNALKSGATLSCYHIELAAMREGHTHW